jgi:predicted oxidoreductase
MNALSGDDLLKFDHIKSQIEARDREMSNPYVKDAQVMNIHNARRYIGDGRLIPHRQAAPHSRSRTLAADRGQTQHPDPQDALGGFETDLDSRVFGNNGEIIKGLYAAGEAAGFAAAAYTAIARWRARFWAGVCFRAGTRRRGGEGGFVIPFGRID